MYNVVEKTKTFNLLPDVLFRDVDDCFAVFPDFESAMLFYGKLNQIRNNVKFTYELENNKQLPFLDVKVDNSKEKLELSVYGNQHTPGCIISEAVWLSLNKK